MVSSVALACTATSCLAVTTALFPIEAVVFIFVDSMFPAGATPTPAVAASAPDRLKWEKSLAAAPEQLDARLNLAKLLCERGRLKDCSRHLDEVLRRDPSNAKARVLYKKMIE